MFILIQRLMIRAVKGVTAFVLGGVILWHVVENCGSTKGIAYVHVSKPEVDITVDNETYHVETLWETPIVCELRPGRHMLRMFQSGRILFEQEFAMDPGQEVVLTAWEAPDTNRDDQLDSSASFNPRLAQSQHARRTP